MKPDWDKLMEMYKDDENILIADVDCTAGGKSLCSDVGVGGYPTIKHGDPNDLEDYEGGRDLDALKTFAKENLGPRCSAANLGICTDEQKKTIEEYMAMSDEDLGALIKEKEAEMTKSDEDLEELLKSLQAQYKEGKETNEAKKKEIKESGLGLLKVVLNSKKTASDEF